MQVHWKVNCKNILHLIFVQDFTDYRCNQIACQLPSSCFQLSLHRNNMDFSLKVHSVPHQQTPHWQLRSTAQERLLIYRRLKASLFHLKGTNAFIYFCQVFLPTMKIQVRVNLPKIKLQHKFMKHFDSLRRIRINLSESSISRCQVKPDPKTVTFYSPSPSRLEHNRGRFFFYFSHFGACLILSQVGRAMG